MDKKIHLFRQLDKYPYGLLPIINYYLFINSLRVNFLYDYRGILVYNLQLLLSLKTNIAYLKLIYTSVFGLHWNIL